MARLVVIGNGVAASAVLHALYRSGKDRKFQSIVQLEHSDLAPATSERSTAVAALRGTRLGLSPLGDELVKMWNFTHQLYSSCLWPGLTSVRLQNWVYSDKAHRRYGHLGTTEHSLHRSRIEPRSRHDEEAWLIDPSLFLSSVPRPTVECLKALVVSLQMKQGQWLLTLLGGEELRADVVILASGAWASWAREWVIGTPLAELRLVQGSYLEWEGIDAGAESFALGIEGLVWTYHASTHRMLLGAHSVLGENSFIVSPGLRDKLKDELLRHADVMLPDGGRLVTGIRSRTKNRHPWAGEVAPGLYAVGGLYKTGWVTAWPLGQQIIDQL